MTSGDAKFALGAVIASRLKDGECIGVGSGSTVEAILSAVGERIRREKLTVFAVATSYLAAVRAETAGFIVLHAASSRKIDWAFDGADEIDPDLNMIKGRGAAIFAEKIIAKRAGGIVVVATEDKLVPKLCTKFPVPIEVVPEAMADVEAELRRLGVTEIVERTSAEKFGPLVTEHGNFLLDCRFPGVSPELDSKIRSIPGVAETGLFYGLAREVLIGKPGIVERRSKSGSETVWKA
jgi:ribose 5-phosphate isomerase A